jgi:hypothetical protein
MPQPGWYPDPSDATGKRLRWFNGTNWTNDVQADEIGVQTSPTSRRTLPVPVLVVAAIAVVGLMVAGWLVVGGGNESAQPGQGPTTSQPASPTTPGSSTPAPPPTGSLVDDVCRQLDETTVGLFLAGERVTTGNYQSYVYLVSDAPADDDLGLADMGFTVTDSCTITTEMVVDWSGVTVIEGNDIDSSEATVTAGNEMTVIAVTGPDLAALIAENFTTPETRIAPLASGDDGGIVWADFGYDIEVPYLAYVRYGDGWLVFSLDSFATRIPEYGDQDPNSLTPEEQQQLVRDMAQSSGEHLNEILISAVTL